MAISYNCRIPVDNSAVVPFPYLKYISITILYLERDRESVIRLGKEKKGEGGEGGGK